MLNTPNNPTGSADNRNDLAALGEVLGTHESVRILTDDIYEHLVYDGFEFMTMTGWRLGYAGGPADSIAAMGNVQQQSSTHASSITQAAALEALTGPQTILQERRDAFRRRRDLVVDALNAIEGLSCIRPDGTFFVYPSCDGLIGKRAPDGRVMESDQDFAAYLLESAGVATVPGTAFGLSPHFRLSFASSTELLQEACQRIGRACAKLR